MDRELFGKTEMGTVVLADYKDAGRIAVNPMHDSRTQVAVDSRKGILTVKHQRIHKRTAVMTGRGMHDHALRLID